jgi:hypothetical protein
MDAARTVKPTGLKTTIGAAALVAAGVALLPASPASSAGERARAAAPEQGTAVTHVQLSRDRRAAKVTVACAAAGVDCDVSLTGTALAGSTSSPLKRVRRGASLYYGAMVRLKVPSKRALKPRGAFGRFERQAGKGMSLVHWGEPWQIKGQMQPFPTTYMENAREHGSIPVLDWTAQKLGAGIRQSRYQSSDIASGRYDDYIREWAGRAKEWGHPFMLRFNHEMNGWWYPWGEARNERGGTVNGNQPGDFVAAWRHVHDLFAEVGATNVTWVWSPNYLSKDPRYLPLSTMYPGDAYVDWTGLSAYNRDRAGGWLTPYAMLTGVGTTYLLNSYFEVVAVAPDKPMLLAETASVEFPGRPKRKAGWIKELLLRALPRTFPQIKGFMWYDAPDEYFPTQPVASSRPARRAFKKAIGSSRYAGNDFASLDRSPIRPLRQSRARKITRLHMAAGASKRVKLRISRSTAALLRQDGGTLSLTAVTAGSPLPPATQTVSVAKAAGKRG